jgi:hypothetical protein
VVLRPSILSRARVVRRLRRWCDMAVLYITEYAQLMPSPVGGQGQMPMEPPLAEQTVAIGGSSTASNAFNASTRFIRVHSDAICAVEVGATPTATVASGGAGSGRMAANQTEYRGVPIGQSYKIAVISTS